jgi:hypothetical protein
VRSHPILDLQRTVGNQAVQRLLNANTEDLETGCRSTVTTRPANHCSLNLIYTPVQKTVQTKLTINERGDKYEQEADRIADQLMRRPDAKHQRTCACGGGCPKCRNKIEQLDPKEEIVQNKRVKKSIDAAPAAPSAVNGVLAAAGQPLSMTMRAFMESRFGQDFEAVRVHTDGPADAAARSIGALAFTSGEDIVFGEGLFAPDTGRGKNLLAHELAHVVQQRSRTVTPQLQARVVDDDEHLPCRATAGRNAAYLTARENQAATMAENAATALRATPIGEPERRLLWERLRLDYNDPLIRCRQIASVADRFARVAREIRNTDCTYRCAAAGQPPGPCAKGGIDAYTHVGLSRRIDLCVGFWNAPQQDQEAILLHEWMHYVFLTRGLRDDPSGGFDTADCYAIFADARRRGNAHRDDGSCPARTGAVPAADRARQRQQCPSNVFETLSILGGYAYGLGGRDYGLVGAGLDFNFPLTRMHDWELALGPRFTALLPTDSTARNAYLTGVRAGLLFRYRPWRFGFQVGGYAEAGGAALPDTEEGYDWRPYAAGGLTAGLNIPLGRSTDLQVLLDVGGGARLDEIEAPEDDSQRGWFQAGLGVAIQFQ